MVLNYLYLGMVHDLLGIMAYTLAIRYYALKLRDLKRRNEESQG